MKITYIHQYFKTSRGFGGVRSYEIAKVLVAHGHEVNMITSCTKSSKDSREYSTIEDGIRVHWIPVPYSNSFSFVRRMVAFIKFSIKSSIKVKSLKSDIIYATSTPLSVGVVGVFASYVHSAPLVFEVRDLWPTVPISIAVLKNPFLIWIAKKIESLVYRKSEAVIALSPGMRDGIINSGCPKEKVATIPNFSDLELFSPFVKKDTQKDKRDFDGPLLVYTGTFGMINGLGYLVELAKELAAINSNVNILLLGDGRELSHVTRMAKEYGVLNDTLFICRPIGKERLPQILSMASMSSNIVINNEDVWTNSASKFFDGLASGTPMLINSGGWQADLLQRYNAGVSTYGLSLQDAADKINRLLNDDQWVVEVGNNALKLAEEHFDKVSLINDVEKLLVEALHLNGDCAYNFGLKDWDEKAC